MLTSIPILNIVYRILHSISSEQWEMTMAFCVYFYFFPRNRTVLIDWEGHWIIVLDTSTTLNMASSAKIPSICRDQYSCQITIIHFFLLLYIFLTLLTQNRRKYHYIVLQFFDLNRGACRAQ